MATAEELIVAIRSEGVGETQSQLEGVERSMEETADSAGDSADELEGFSQRFQGAMAAAVSALAIGAAGILAQVPVLSESLAGLGAIVSALAFQMDGVLRPVLNPLTNLFFEISNAIFEADGTLGTIIGTITTIVSILAIAIPAIAAVGAQLGTWASVGAGVVAILKAIGGVIAAVIGGISATAAAIGLAVAAIVGFALAYATNFRGVRDTTNRIIGQIIDFVVGGFLDLASMAITAISDFVEDTVSWFADLASDLSDWASDIAEDAFEWGADLIRGLLEGIRAFAGLVVNAFEDVINGIIDTINTALDQLPDEISSRVGVEQFERVDFAADFSSQTSGGSASGRARAPPSGTSGATFLDGRNVSEQTGRYRADPGRRRGL